MRRLLHRALFITGIAFAGCATSFGVGKPAPDFSLPRLGGGTVALSQFRGSVVVVDFWASWCGPCREELPALEKLRKEYEPRGVRFVGVNIDDDREAAAHAAEQLGLTMPIALDTDKQAAQSFQPPTMPTSFVIDRGGVVRFVHEGWSGAPDVDAFHRELEQLLAAK
jgi:peroxiredoxin